MSNYTKRIVRGTLLIFAMTIVTTVLQYAFRLVLAHGLTKADFGLFFSVLSLTGILFFARDLGLKAALVRFIPEFVVRKRYDLVKASVKIVFLMQFLASLILAIFLIILSKFIANGFYHTARAEPLIIVMALVCVTYSLVFIFHGIFQGFQRVLLFSVIEFLYILFALGLTLLFLQKGTGVLAPGYAYFLAGIVLAPILFLLFRKYVFTDFFQTRSRISRDLVTKLTLFAMPVMLTAGSLLILSYTGTLALTYFRSLETVADYNVALPISKLILFFSMSLSLVFFPLSSELWAKKKIQLLKDGTRRLLNLMFVFLLPVALVLIVFPEIVIRVFFGQAFINAATPLRILTIGFFFYSLFMINQTLLNGIGKPSVINKIVAYAVVINVLLSLALVVPFGGIGAALATAISSLILLLLSSVAMRREIKLDVPIKNWLKTFVAAIVFLLIIAYVKHVMVAHFMIELVVSATIASAVYVFMIWSFKVVTLDELKNIINQVRL